MIALHFEGDWRFFSHAFTVNMFIVYHTFFIGVNSVYLMDMILNPLNDRQFRSLFYNAMLAVFFAITLNSTSGVHMKFTISKLENQIQGLKSLTQEVSFLVRPRIPLIRYVR